MKIVLPEKVTYIIDTLTQHGFEAYAVGGCVRDTMLGRIPMDWDITTSAKPEQVKELFRHTIDTGIQHGTVTVMLEHEGFEVTTYRIDGEYEDARHPKEVQFTSNLLEDLKRRDFTINAMAYNDKDGLVDAFDGVGDLEQIAVFTVNSDNDKMVIQDEQKASGKALGMMLPYFITILLFAGAMGIGTDMIAGEKERGTMASLLVAPIKRSSIVLGKVFALMALSGISSVIYVGAMVAFMPLMSKSMLGTSGENLNISLNANQIAMLAVLLIGVAFLYSTMIALTSVFAKTIKEATTYVKS